MKLISVNVPEVAEGLELYAMLRRLTPQLTERCLRDAFKRRDVKMDGMRVPRNTPAKPGAKVQIYISDDCAPLSPEILYEDQNLLVVRKPVGFSCDRDDMGSPTIGEWVYQCYKDRLAQEPLLCHRLDNPTDGLLILAKDERTQLLMEKAFRAREVHKRYICLVRGEPFPRSTVLEAYLVKDAERALVRVYDQPVTGGVCIRTGYRVLEGGEVSRLEVTLLTGRTHQIRAQLAHCGHPLLGDDKYGNREFNRAHHAWRLMLTATELTFTITGELAYLNDMHFAIKPEF